MTVAWITLLQNESRNVRDPVTPATSPASDSVRNCGLDSRVRTSSSRSLAHYAVCLTRSSNSKVQDGHSVARYMGLRLAGADAIDACVDTHQYSGESISVPSLWTCRWPIELTGILRSPTILVYRIPNRFRGLYWSATALSDLREIVCSQPRTTLRRDWRRQRCKF
jgi:hypothetical protein